jgi:hypothetical protein
VTKDGVTVKIQYIQPPDAPSKYPLKITSLNLKLPNNLPTTISNQGTYAILLNRPATEVRISAQAGPYNDDLVIEPWTAPPPPQKIIPGADLAGHYHCSASDNKCNNDGYIRVKDGKLQFANTSPTWNDGTYDEDRSEVTVPAWGNLVGTVKRELKPLEISWSNGTLWTFLPK